MILTSMRLCTIVCVRSIIIMYTTALFGNVSIIMVAGSTTIIIFLCITLYSHIVSSAIMRWGVLGCANIAKKNIRAIIQAGKEFKSSSDLIAVASRNVDKGHAFVRTLVDMGILSSSDAGKIKVYGSYEDLISDGDIDAVYIPLPSALHDEWATKVADSGKHILLEKPSATNSSALLQIIYNCQKNKVLLMDGVMYMHHARLGALRRQLADSFCSKVVRVSSSFSFNGAGGDFLASNIRTKYDCDPLGALGDLGWYCIRLGIIAFNQGRDEAVFSSGTASADAIWPLHCTAKCNNWNEERVPLDCEVVVSFGRRPADKKQPTEDFSSAVLSFDCSFLLPFRQSFEICSTGTAAGLGDKIIRCDDFVIPRYPKQGHFDVESFSAAGPLTDCDTRVISTMERVSVQSNVDQETNMFHTFSQLAASAPDSPSVRYWKVISMLTQATVDACMLSMNHNGKVIPVELLTVDAVLG